MINVDRKPARWILGPHDPEAAERLARDLNVAPVTGALLRQRLPDADTEAARCFLNPNLTDLPDPMDLPDMDVAAERVAKAIRDGERILVYGEYDCDGVTASAVLQTILRALGAEVDTYLPHRVAEGYGISEAFVEQVLGDPPGVLVTATCSGSRPGSYKLTEGQAGVNEIF